MPLARGVVVYIATSVLRGENIWGLSQLARELNLPALSLDLGGVHALTAEGLGKLLALHRDLRLSGAKLTLVNVGDEARQAIEAAGLTGVLDVRSPGGSQRPPSRRVLNHHPGGCSRRTPSRRRGLPRV